MQQLAEGTLLQGGKFKIEKSLGQGGFGITYLATQTISVEGSIGEIKTEIKLAIKEFFMKDVCNRDENSTIVSVPSVGSKELVERFKQKFIKEARSISKLKHPHIVRVVDIFEENNTAYYVMEYHSGGSLNDLVKDGNPLPEADAVRYITQIADAVGYIHKQKINHLDIKPGNILLDGKANGILIDFGLSKQYDEQGSQTSSTPVGISHGYAPMEQYKQNGVSTFSPQSDIYSLGATLYKLVTGVTPPQAMDIFNDGLPALPAHLSDGVKRAIEQSLKPRKIDRPATAEEFIALLGASGEAADSEETMVNALHEETFIDVQPKVTVVSEPAKKTPEQPAEPKKPEPKKPEPEKPAKKGGVWKWVAVLVILGVSVWQTFVGEKYISSYEDGLAKVRIGKWWGLYSKSGFIDKSGNVVIPIKYDDADGFSEGLACVELNGKDGFIDKSGNVVIPLKYDFAWSFREGLARVKLNGKYGFIDKSGNEVIPLKYDDASIFREGLAPVKLNGKWGFIDKNDNVVIPLKYDYTAPFYKGRTWVELNGETFHIDKKGNRVD